MIYKLHLPGFFTAEMIPAEIVTLRIKDDNNKWMWPCETVGAAHAHLYQWVKHRWEDVFPNKPIEDYSKIDAVNKYFGFVKNADYSIDPRVHIRTVEDAESNG